MTHELHPLSTLFPRLPDAELRQLADDIAANGLQQPIVLHDGMILDGGNRYRACLLAGVEPVFTTFAGASIVQFVLGANLHRRHLTPGQQAAIVAAAQDWARAHVPGSNQHKAKASGPATLPDLETVADRAAQSGASERTQRMADKVARESPELVRKVAHGEITLPQAVREVAPQIPKPKPGPEDDLQARIDELSAALAEATADNESMARVFDANDQLAAAVAEAKRYREQARLLQERIDGLMREKSEAVRSAKAWKAKYEKLQRVTGTSV